MIKLTFCLTRLPHLSREQFQAYWLETHAPLVAGVKDALRIRRYVQTHSALEQTGAALQAVRGGPAGYDGVAELWWESWSELEANSADPAASAAGALLLEDERRFIDLTRSPLWWGEEKTIV